MDHTRPTTPEIEKVAPGVAVVKNLYDPELMDAIVASAEANIAWQTDPTRGTLYDAVVLANFAPELADQLRRATVDRAFPLLESAFDVVPFAHELALSKLVRGSPFAFVVKYGGDQRSHVAVHRDLAADMTLCVALNDDFVGGGTVFPALGCAASPPKGGAVLFSGKRLDHASLPVVSGIRYIATIWVTALHRDER